MANSAKATAHHLGKAAERYTDVEARVSCAFGGR